MTLSGGGRDPLFTRLARFTGLAFRTLVSLRTILTLWTALALRPPLTPVVPFARVRLRIAFR